MWSEDLTRAPPTHTAVKTCDSAITLATVSFTGGVGATMLNWFRTSIKSMVGDELNALLCSNLEDFVSGPAAVVLRLVMEEEGGQSVRG